MGEAVEKAVGCCEGESANWPGLCRFRQIFNFASGSFASLEQIGLLGRDLHRWLRATVLTRRMSARDPSHPDKLADKSISGAYHCLVEANLPGLSLVYRLSHHYRLACCSSDIRGHQYLGPNQIIVYEKQLKCRLCFPLLPFLSKFWESSRFLPLRFIPTVGDNLLGPIGFVKKGVLA